MSASSTEQVQDSGVENTAEQATTKPSEENQSVQEAAIADESLDIEQEVPPADDPASRPAKKDLDGAGFTLSLIHI